MRRRGHSIELAAAMIGDDDAVGAELGRRDRIVPVKDALDDQWSVPGAPNVFQVLPGNRRVEIVAHPSEEVLKPGVFA